MNYGSASSAPAYSAPPHHPYFAPPHSHLAPTHQQGPQYYHHPSMHTYPPQHPPITFPQNSQPPYWPLATNAQKPPINYSYQPGRAETSHPSQYAYTPQDPINTRFDQPVHHGSNPGLSEHPQGRHYIDTQQPGSINNSHSDQRNHGPPAAKWENACWEFGDPRENFQELQSTLVPPAPEDINPLPLGSSY
jgi:hypothetical protein